MRLRWTPSAAADLEGIKNYLEEKAPHLAQSTVERLYRGVKELKVMPLLGRPGRIAGTRELVLPPLPYIAVYRVRGDAIEILRFYHGAQDWGQE